MNRELSLNNILSNRKEYLEKAKESKIRFSKLSETLNNLGNLTDVMGQILPEQSTVYANLKNQIATCVPLVNKKLSEYDKIIHRFNRSTVNIGVAGLAGQGKSTFLQNLTGLSDDEIPTASAGHCTGAPSFIVNTPSNTETYAIIEFFQEQEFIKNIIQPYFNDLDLAQTPPSSIRDFESFCFPSLAEYKEKNKDSTQKIVKFEALLKTKEALSQFKPLLGNSSIKIPKNQIREYVAQRSSDGQIYNKWYAVKRADIHCHFPQEDIGRLSVGDTPGLGDVGRSAGTEKELLKTIGSEMDFILFLKLVNPNGERGLKAEETRLYDLVQEALFGIDARDWSHYIVNKPNDIQQENVNFVIKEITESPIKTRTSSPHVIDARNANEVKNLISNVLDDAVQQLPLIDNKLLQSIAQDKQLHEKISILIEAAKQAIPKALTSNSALLSNLSKNCFDKMQEQLVNLQAKYTEDNDKTEELIKKFVSDIFSPLRETPQVNLSGPKLSAFNNAFYLLRSRLLMAIDSIDNHISKLFKTMQHEVRTILSSPDGGRMSFLATEEEPDEIFWEQLENYTTGPKGSCESNYLHFSKGIKAILDANITFRSIISYRLRPELDRLDPGCTSRDKNGMYRPRNVNYDSVDTELLQEYLDAAWEDTRDICRNIILKIGSNHEISQAMRTAIAELTIQFIYGGGEDQARTQWRLFHEANRGDIWPDEFSSCEENARLRNQWDEAIKDLQTQNK